MSEDKDLRLLTLLAENQALREKVSALEYAMEEGPLPCPEAAPISESQGRATAKLEERIATLEDQLAEEQAHRANLEEEYSSLLNLYAASRQMHTTLRLPEVIGAEGHVLLGPDGGR